MLIKTYQEYREKATPMYESNPHPGCFLCTLPIRFPAIVWVGVTEDIAFHPDCAATFLLAFTRDLHEFKQSIKARLRFTLE